MAIILISKTISDYLNGFESQCRKHKRYNQEKKVTLGTTDLAQQQIEVRNVIKLKTILKEGVNKASFML